VGSGFTEPEPKLDAESAARALVVFGFFGGFSHQLAVAATAAIDVFGRHVAAARASPVWIHEVLAAHRLVQPLSLLELLSRVQVTVDHTARIAHE
jgi:hypothetical protein